MLIVSVDSDALYEKKRFCAMVSSRRCGLTLVLSPLVRVYQPAKSDVSTSKAPSSATAPACLLTGIRLKTRGERSHCLATPWGGIVHVMALLPATRDGLSLK